MVVSSKTKNPKVGQATTIILQSISGGIILSLTDMHGRGLRLKIMWIQFKDSPKTKWVLVLKIYMNMGGLKSV